MLHRGEQEGRGERAPPAVGCIGPGMQSRSQSFQKLLTTKVKEFDVIDHSHQELLIKKELKY